MPLTPEQIKALLAQPTRPKTVGRKPKNYIDLSVRDVVTWFKLSAKLYDTDTEEMAKCENPNCTDMRKVQLIAEINGSKMCRQCFLNGWQTEIEGQEQLTVDSES